MTTPTAAEIGRSTARREHNQSVEFAVANPNAAETAQRFLRGGSAATARDPRCYIGTPVRIRLLNNLQYSSVIDGSLFVFLVRAYFIFVGLLRLIFIGADGLSGHVAWIVVERSRLLFPRLFLVWILCCCPRNSP